MENNMPIRLLQLMTTFLLSTVLISSAVAQSPMLKKIETSPLKDEGIEIEWFFDSSVPTPEQI
tara:strand:- start:234 stop:422 length:189 start_codon:yes stop_codon:yes gene_type:complete